MGDCGAAQKWNARMERHLCSGQVLRLSSSNLNVSNWMKELKKKLGGPSRFYVNLYPCARASRDCSGPATHTCTGHTGLFRSHDQCCLHFTSYRHATVSELLLPVPLEGPLEECRPNGVRYRCLSLPPATETLQLSFSRQQQSRFCCSRLQQRLDKGSQICCGWRYLGPSASAESRAPSTTAICTCNSGEA